MALLPYRSVRVHDGAECVLCAPTGPGHQACQNSKCSGASDHDGRGRAAVAHVLRHATDLEYANIPPAHRPIDGVAHQAVFACDDCAEDACEPFCEHVEPTPQACPACGVADPAPCLKKDGKSPRAIPHAARPPVVHEVCRHAHRPDCGIFEGCACTGDDPIPGRPKAPLGATPGPDVSGLTIPVPAAQMILAQHGIHWSQVAAARSLYTQDTRPGVAADVHRFDDAGDLLRDVHGHAIVDTVGPFPLEQRG